MVNAINSAMQSNRVKKKAQSSEEVLYRIKNRRETDQRDRKDAVKNNKSSFYKSIKSGYHKMMISEFGNQNAYTSFSGADSKVSIAFPGGKPVFIGEAQTVTYSLFRPMSPVHRLGSAAPSGFVRGPRTIAGSIIFTVFDRNVLLNAFHNAYANYKGTYDCLEKEFLTDELPPFDIHITFLNEYGQSAIMGIHGIHITSEGQVHSIEDMITENTIQYVAQDLTLMQPDIAELNYSQE